MFKSLKTSDSREALFLKLSDVIISELGAVDNSDVFPSEDTGIKGNDTVERALLKLIVTLKEKGIGGGSDIPNNELIQPLSDDIEFTNSQTVYPLGVSQGDVTEANGWPANGSITNYRIGDTGYQIYTPDREEPQLRWWDGSDWSDLTPLEVPMSERVQFLPDATVTTPPLDFPEGQSWFLTEVPNEAVMVFRKGDIAWRRRQNNPGLLNYSRNLGGNWSPEGQFHDVGRNRSEFLQKTGSDAQTVNPDTHFANALTTANTDTSDPESVVGVGALSKKALLVDSLAWTNNALSPRNNLQEGGGVVGSAWGNLSYTLNNSTEAGAVAVAMFGRTFYDGPSLSGITLGVYDDVGVYSIISASAPDLTKFTSYLGTNNTSSGYETTGNGFGWIVDKDGSGARIRAFCKPTDSAPAIYSDDFLLTTSQIRVAVIKQGTTIYLYVAEKAQDPLVLRSQFEAPTFTALSARYRTHLFERLAQTDPPLHHADRGASRIYPRSNRRSNANITIINHDLTPKITCRHYQAHSPGLRIIPDPIYRRAQNDQLRVARIHVNCRHPCWLA